jgi:uncharacterized protein YjdB
MSNKTIMVALGAMLALSVGVLSTSIHETDQVHATSYTATIKKATTTSGGTTAVLNGEILTYGTGNRDITKIDGGGGTASFVVTYYRNDATTHSIYNNSAGEIRLYPRLTNGGQLNFEIQGDFKITSARFKTSKNPGASVNGGVTFTDKDKTIDFESETTLVTFKNTFNATGGGNLQLTEAIFTYESTGSEVVPVTGVELNKSETTIETGATEQLTATVSPGNATDKGVSWESTNEAIATVSTNGLVTAVSVGQATITVKTNDGDFEDDCVVTVTEVIFFSKITSTSQLYFGATYILVAENSNMAMNTTFGDFAGNTSVTITSNTISNQTDIQKLQLVISPATGTYGFKLINGPSADKYLALLRGSGDNDLSAGDDLVENASWFVTFDEGNAIINSKIFSDRHIRYNSTSPRFATYRTTFGVLVQLYLSDEEIDHTAEATMLATEINTGIGSGAQGNCTSAFEILDSAYDRLSSSAKTIFDQSSDTAFVNARARLSYLEQWVDFNAGSPVAISLNMSFDSNILANVLVILIVSSISAYAYSQLKKRYNRT